MRSNREYNYFGNLLEDDYFASYSYTSTITPSQLDADMNIYKSNSYIYLTRFQFFNAALLVI